MQTILIDIGNLISWQWLPGKRFPVRAIVSDYNILTILQASLLTVKWSAKDVGTTAGTDST